MNVKPWILAILAGKASQGADNSASGDGGTSSSSDGCTGVLAMFALLLLDAIFLLVAWFAWMVYWPVAIVFTMPSPCAPQRSSINSGRDKPSRQAFGGWSV
jgi:hypothetical protein